MQRRSLLCLRLYQSRPRPKLTDSWYLLGSNVWRLRRHRIAYNYRLDRPASLRSSGLRNAGSEMHKLVYGRLDGRRLLDAATREPHDQTLRSLLVGYKVQRLRWRFYGPPSQKSGLDQSRGRAAPDRL